MKIAVISDDGKSISQHFGRAAYYVVVTVEDGQVTARETRDKVGHNQFTVELGDHEHHHEHHHEHGEEGHGLDEASHDRHARMAGNISDCEAVLCGGMGRGAYESMRRMNIRPVVTVERDVDTAALAYAAGTLVDHTDRLH